jgi:hypothetical protein
VRAGKPTAVFLGIDEYRELLEKVEDAADLKMLKAMRKKPLKFQKLEEFLKEPLVYEVLIERAAERDLRSLPTTLLTVLLLGLGPRRRRRIIRLRDIRKETALGFYEEIFHECF